MAEGVGIQFYSSELSAPSCGRTQYCSSDSPNTQVREDSSSLEPLDDLRSEQLRQQVATFAPLDLEVGAGLLISGNCALVMKRKVCVYVCWGGACVHLLLPPGVMS